MTSQSATWSPIQGLTPRQHEILALLSKGLTNQDIGLALGISPATVRTHVTAILSKLEVGNRTEAASVYCANGSSPEVIGAVLERPAIVVLPMAAVGEDDRSRTVAAGITHELSHLLSRWCWFPVIAVGMGRGGGPASTDAPQEQGRQLGAAYVVDGAVRAGQESWRLTVRVVETAHGHCLWSEQQDFTSAHFFEAQDAMCRAMVATLYPVLVQHSTAGLRQTGAATNQAAWELAHMGMELTAMREAAANARARECFQRALSREPGLVLAHFGLGLGAYDQVLNQWGDTTAGQELLVECAHRCMDLAPHAAEGHYLLGRHFQTRGDHQGAVTALETAIVRNPSFAAAHALLAQALQLSGRSDEAVLRMGHALRLGPRAFGAGLASLHFARKDYQLALDAAERAVAMAPHYTYARILAAAAAWWAGNRQRASLHARELQAHHPRFVPNGFLQTFGARVEAVENVNRALRELNVATSPGQGRRLA